MTGPIRPSLDYVINLVSHVKTAIPNIQTHIGYWKTTDEHHAKLKEHFNVVHAFEEPSNELIDDAVQTARTRQQFEYDGKLEGWKYNMYKIFYCIRKLVESSSIPDSDVVIRIRTDLSLEPDSVYNICKLNVNPNSFYYPHIPTCGGCDWFSISSYEVYKKTYYIPNDTVYRVICSSAFNAEEMVLINGRINGVTLCIISESLVRMALCRKFENGVKTLQFFN